jgi:hypothetical protein
MNIIDAIENEKIFKPLFRDPATWRPWMVFLRALFGLPIEDPADLELFRASTGLAESPKERIRECTAICGRRSGKSFISALVTVFLACFKDWTPWLSRGERGMIFIIAVDRTQARIIKEYVSAILDSTPILRKLVREDLKEEIVLKNRIVIEIKTNSYRSIRGFTCLAAVLEETAFWRSDLTANPDREVINALRPALGTIPESLLISISTPYSRRGILYDTYKRSFGQAGRTLVWKAPSLVMNPTLDAELVKDALREDPAAAAAEWECEWRADIESFLPFEALQACVVTDRTEIPPLHGVRYTAFIDPSFGGQDSFTLAIAHGELGGQVRILDLIREFKPGFRPEQAVVELSAVVKAYRCFEVISDRFSRDWVKTEFEKYGVRVKFSPKSVSELYLDFLPLVTSRAVELLDNRRLIGQLGNLERRVRSGGRDLVTHFPGQHDDIGNAAAGVLCFAGKRFGSVCTTFEAEEAEERAQAAGRDESRPLGVGFRKFIGRY